MNRPWTFADRELAPRGGGEEMMTVIQIIGWSVIAAVVGWRLAWNRARATIADISTKTLTESRQWRAESERWRAEVARLSREIDAWKSGHQEGRADLISMVPLLVSARRDSSTCTCTTAAQVKQVQQVHDVS